MAEALLRKLGKKRFEVHSAGLHPAKINPYVKRVMREIDMDLIGQYFKNIDAYIGKMYFDYLITLCSYSEKQCPGIFPGIGEKLHWSFEDPAAFVRSESETLTRFREIRDQIEKCIKAWLEEQDKGD
jgi:arsenate reductase